MSDWYYTVDGQQRGPVSAEVLHQLAANGQLRPTDMLWEQGMPQWVAASQTTLFAAPAPPPVPVDMGEPGMQPAAMASEADDGVAPQDAAMPLSYAVPGRLSSDSIPATPVVWVGVFLLIAFFFPIADGQRAVNPNFLALTERGVPLEIRLFYVFPLIGGVAVLTVSRSRSLARPITMLACGVIPILLLTTSRGLRQGMTGEQSPGLGIVQVLFAGLALMGMLVGSWVAIRRPSHPAGAILGAIGAGLYLLSLFVPASAPFSLGTSSTIGLFAPFRMLTAELPHESFAIRTLAVVSIAQMACLIVAAIVCFMLAANREGAPTRARTALRLAVWAVALAIGGVGVAIVAEAESVAQGPALMTLTKVVSWMTGLFMPFPVGLADLILNVIPKPEQQVLAAPPATA